MNAEVTLSVQIVAELHEHGVNVVTYVGEDDDGRVTLMSFEDLVSDAIDYIGLDPDGNYYAADLAELERVANALVAAGNSMLTRVRGL